MKKLKRNEPFSMKPTSKDTCKKYNSSIKEVKVNYTTKSLHEVASIPACKQTPWPLVRKRTIPTELPPLVDEILCLLLWIEECRVVSAADPPRSLISVF
jgi:hypothetical protein